MTTIAGLSDEAAASWLETHRTGVTPEQALAFFDGLPTVPTADMIGRWRGSGLPTGSRLDGLLEAYGWYGKEFRDAETAHPLLFRDRSGVPHPVDPAYAPLGLLFRLPQLARTRAARLGFAAVRPLRRTEAPAARVRTLEHRGVATAAMVYDALPVIDVFRRTGPGSLLGLVDARGLDEPFFFVLERDA